MSTKFEKALLLDLDRCVGCYACQIACKQANNLPEGISWIRVVTVGPKKVNGKMSMDFLLKISDECNFCSECIEVCPTEALMSCQEEAKLLELLRDAKSYQVSLLTLSNS